MGVAKSIELYCSIDEREHSGNPYRTLPGGNGKESFLVVDWEEYAQAGHALFIYPGVRKRSPSR